MPNHLFSQLRKVETNLSEHLLVGDRGRAFLPVLSIHPVSDLLHRLRPFIDTLGRRNIEVGVNPPRHASGTRSLVHRHTWRPAEDLASVEDVVNLFVLQQTVSVNPRPRHIKITTDE